MMLHSHIIRRTLQISACGGALLLCTTPGKSEPDSSAPAPVSKEKRAACKAAYKGARQLEQSAKLRQARDMLLTCAKATCGALLKQQCTNLYLQLDQDIPSVVPLVTDDAGAPRVNVQVTMDGEVLTSRLDGRSLPVDPGLHEFSFSSDTGVFATQSIMIVQGQRNRPLSVALHAGEKRGKRTALGPASAAGIDAKASLDKPAVDKQSIEKPAAEPTASEKVVPEKAAPEKSAVDDALSEGPSPNVHPKSGPGPLPYVLSAAGLAGIGGFALLSTWGSKDNEALSACAPDCSPDSVAHIKRLYIAADVSLGVGIAALGTGLYMLLASPGSKEAPPTQAKYHFDVKPGPSGGFASLSGSF
jgi:hypothetical protein